MNAVPKTPLGAEGDEEQLKKQSGYPEMIEGEEEESGVFSSAPTLERLNKKLEANRAFVEEIRRKNGYYERRIEAEMQAKNIAAQKGQDAAEKYLEEFEKIEAQRVKDEIKREGVEEQFDYERAAPPREKIPAEFFESSVRESTQAKVIELLRPLELDAGDLFTKRGRDILGENLSKSFLGILESGDKKPVGVTTSFNGSEVVAITSPGLRKKNGEYPENRDGFVIMKTADGQGLQVVMSHGVSEGPEAAALANAASVSAGYDLNRMHPPHLTEVFERINDQVNGVKEELDIPKQRLSLLGVTVKKDYPEAPLFAVEVLSAGDIHCFVVDNMTGSVSQITPATVAGELENAKIPMGRRKELLEKYSQQTGAPVEQIEKVLTMSAGQSSETFKPLLSELTAAPGEIVVVASGDFMRAMGGQEYFQDGTLAKQLSARLKKGQKLSEALAEITKNIVRRQQNGTIEESPVSIVAFEVPGAEKLRTKPQKQETVEEFLKRTEVPLQLDFDDLEKSA